MPRPRMTENLRDYQREVDALWGKLDVVSSAPLADEMNEGDAAVDEANKKLYVKAGGVVLVFSPSEEI